MLQEEGRMMYWNGKWAAVLLFCFNIILESSSRSVCFWSIIISLLSLILSLRFPLIHHRWVCVRQPLWIMRWPFHWHGPGWPSLDTTGLNSIHHNSIRLVPSQAGMHMCLSVWVYKTLKATVYGWGCIDRSMQTADAGRQGGGGGGLDSRCEKTTRLFRS